MTKTSLTIIWVRTQFVAFHRWPEAPNEVAFLRDFHRHVFHVELSVVVGHDDREVEFFTLKKALDEVLCLHFEGTYSRKSCEQFAKDIAGWFNYLTVGKITVSEDGENGATVVFYSVPEIESIP